jgi:hypothetical protein
LNEIVVFNTSFCLICLNFPLNNYSFSPPLIPLVIRLIIQKDINGSLPSFLSLLNIISELFFYCIRSITKAREQVVSKNIVFVMNEARALVARRFCFN